jgi:hypothetical protein
VETAAVAALMEAIRLQLRAAPEGKVQEDQVVELVVLQVLQALLELLVAVGAEVEMPPQLAQEVQADRELTLLMRRMVEGEAVAVVAAHQQQVGSVEPAAIMEVVVVPAVPRLRRKVTAVMVPRALFLSSIRLQAAHLTLAGSTALRIAGRGRLIGLLMSHE